MSEQTWWVVKNRETGIVVSTRRDQNAALDDKRARDDRYRDIESGPSPLVVEEVRASDLQKERSS